MLCCPRTEGTRKLRRGEKRTGQCLLWADPYPRNQTPNDHLNGLAHITLGRFCVYMGANGCGAF